MGGITKGIGKLLGVDPGKADNAIQNYRPTGFTSAGLSADVSGQNVNMTRSSLLNNTITGLGSAFNNQATQLGGMRDQLAPGFGAITQAAVSNLENRRRSAIGNLRENLQRRRVLGSSFAADALARTEAEFAQQEAAIRAQTKMQEIGSNIDLINQEAQARANAFNVQLQQLNLEAQIATQISTGVSAISAQNAQIRSQLVAEGQNAVAGGILGAVGIGAGLAFGG